MDHLIEQVPAPDAEAVKLKLELALQRAQGFVAMEPAFERAIFADISRLAASRAGEAA